MNNIVESYLLFKANNICKYIDILAKEMRMISKIPKQLNKLIYKYYDLFVLSDREIDYELLKVKTGLSDNNDRLLLFYLLIEFDMASKTEFKDECLYSFYNFIVNSIIVFVELEREKTLNENASYDDLIQKVLKKYLEYINDDYMILLDKMHIIMAREYNVSYKKELKFRENYDSQVYDIYFSKIKRSDNFYLGKFRYKNEKLNQESRKDVELINNEFLLELNLVNIEITSMKILYDALSCNKKKVFIKLEDDVFNNKNNLSNFMNLIKLRFLKKKMVFVINTGILEKNEEKVNYLIQEGFMISYSKNSELIAYNVYKNGGYFFVNDDENIKSCLKFANDNNLEIIINKNNKKKLDKLNNVMYVT